MDVKLVMFKANGQRREFPIPAKGAVIGRNTECDLQIPLGTISRKHTQVSIDDKHVKVRDLGSSNGTFVNEQRVQETIMRPGDTLMVGPVIFTVVIDGQPETVKPVRTVIVENSVEPVNQQREEHGTVDQEAESEDARRMVKSPRHAEAEDDLGIVDLAEEPAPAKSKKADANNPLSALQALTQPKKK